MTFPKKGVYVGRLAFNPDTGFHIDPKGRKVVTLDEGKTWRYASRKDASHTARYQRRVLPVDSTTETDPHHVDPHPDDPHREGLTFHTDVEAPTVTSHTAAWRQA